MESTTPHALELSRIEKSFGGVRALRGADLAVRRGEIMGLCGENGAGKSTLIKVLAGVYPHGSFAGSVVVGGVEQKLLLPADSIRAGIAVVHQELMLVPELSVAQNLFLGREPRRFGLIDDARLEAMAREALARFGFAGAIDATKPVAQLGIGLQQIVEIIRALSLDTKILVLDEPTAALTGQEAHQLLAWLRRLRDEGTTCIYVSHRLDEVFALCDRVTVLRDGRTTATLVTAETTAETIVSLMVGHSVGTTGRARPRDASQSPERPPALAVTDYGVFRASGARTADRGGRPQVVDGLSFALQPGEVVAVCGAMGSGRTALLSSLFGCSFAGTTGRVAIAGAPAHITSPMEAIARGLAFVPEDRKGRGLVLSMTVAENLALPSLASPDVMGPRARLGLVDSVGEVRLAARRIKELFIRGKAAAVVSTLSGGNQQKVVLGKWLEHPPKVLLLDEPTRGVDVGAREEIYTILEGLAAQGVAILFASSDLAEVLRLAQRILVIRNGRLAGELDGPTATEASIVNLSTGATSYVSSVPQSTVASIDGASTAPVHP